jgi:homocitrate synthase NifV
VFQSEAGFPTTKHETLYLQANLEHQENGHMRPLRLSGWLRATADDVNLAFDMVPKLKHLNLSISTSEQMINGKWGGRVNSDDVINGMVKALDTARSRGAETIGINAEDASRTSMDVLIRFARAAKEHGADRVRYCDTLGYDNPFSIYDTLKTLTEAIEMPVEVHCHGDLGMAVANSLAGAKAVLDAGQDVYINTTINGIGERAGNADLVATVLAVTRSKGFGTKYQLGRPIDLKKAWRIAQYASYAFAVPIPINQPGVGSNAFAHASGIHADGVLKDPENYELYSYEDLGRGEPEMVETGREICSGEYGGLSGFRHIMGRMAVTFEDAEDARRKVELVRYANVLAQKPLVTDELKFICRYPDIARKLMTLIPE